MQPPSSVCHRHKVIVYLDDVQVLYLAHDEELILHVHHLGRIPVSNAKVYCFADHFVVLSISCVVYDTKAPGV